MILNKYKSTWQFFKATRAVDQLSEGEIISLIELDLEFNNTVVTSSITMSQIVLLLLFMICFQGG